MRRLSVLLTLVVPCERVSVMMKQSSHAYKRGQKRPLQAAAFPECSKSRSSRLRLELVADANLVAWCQLVDIVHLLRHAVVDALVFTSQIDAFEGNGNLLIDVIADVQIVLTVILNICTRPITALVRVEKERVTPVISKTCREAVLLVDRSQVSRVGQADKGKLIVVDASGS